MDARISLRPSSFPAKDLIQVSWAVSFSSYASTELDPSREHSPIIMQCAKPIPMAQFDDNDQALWTTYAKNYFISAVFRNETRNITRPTIIITILMICTMFKAIVDSNDA